MPVPHAKVEEQFLSLNSVFFWLFFLGFCLLPFRTSTWSGPCLWDISVPLSHPGSTTFSGQRASVGKGSGICRVVQRLTSARVQAVFILSSERACFRRRLSSQWMTTRLRSNRQGTTWREITSAIELTSGQGGFCRRCPTTLRSISLFVTLRSLRRRQIWETILIDNGADRTHNS